MESRRFTDGRRFAEIWRDGADVETIEGRLGTDGTDRRERFDNEAAAIAYVARWCNQRLTDGMGEEEPDDQATAVRVLLGSWDGLRPQVTLVVARGTEVSESTAAVTERRVEDSLISSQGRTRVMADARAARAWAESRVTERVQQGATRLPDRPALADWPPLPAPLLALVRTAWIPEFGPTSSPVGWTGGRPRLAPEQPWPSVDGAALTFAGAFQHPRQGWFQLFFDGGEHDHVTTAILPLGTESRDAPPGVRVFESRLVRAWTERPELPHSDELAALFPRVWKHGAPLLADANHAGTKLGGWPSWIQGVEVPRTGLAAPMLRIQLYDDPPGMMWGTDSGRLYVFHGDQDISLVQGT